jgi:hypothetical protein
VSKRVPYVDMAADLFPEAAPFSLPDLLFQLETTEFIDKHQLGLGALDVKEHR